MRPAAFPQAAFGGLAAAAGCPRISDFGPSGSIAFGAGVEAVLEDDCEGGNAVGVGLAAFFGAAEGAADGAAPGAAAASPAPH